MGNPSVLRSFPDQVNAHPPHPILAQARRLAKWGGVCDWSGQGFFNGSGVTCCSDLEARQ
jgi:hypothetical protein